MHFIENTIEFKKQARLFKKEHHIKHCAALDLVAKEQGFEKWSQFESFTNSCASLKASFFAKFWPSSENPFCSVTDRYLFKDFSVEEAVNEVSPEIKQNVKKAFTEGMNLRFVKADLVKAYKLVKKHFMPEYVLFEYEDEPLIAYKTIETTELFSGVIEFETTLNENDKIELIQALGDEKWVPSELLNKSEAVVIKKYTKKELEFISTHDLRYLEAYSEYASPEQQATLQKVIHYAEGLINDSDQQHVAELFKLAESVQDELEDQLNDLDEKEALTEEQTEQYNLLDRLSNELRVLINLSPERVLTWEDVSGGFI